MKISIDNNKYMLYNGLGRDNRENMSIARKGLLLQLKKVLPERKTFAACMAWGIFTACIN